MSFRAEAYESLQPALHRRLSEEVYEGEEFAEKLIAIDRIQSATEKYVLVSSSHGRVMYWEYDSSLAQLTGLLAKAGLVVD